MRGGVTYRKVLRKNEVPGHGTRSGKRVGVMTSFFRTAVLLAGMTALFLAIGYTRFT